MSPGQSSVTASEGPASVETNKYMNPPSTWNEAQKKRQSVGGTPLANGDTPAQASPTAPLSLGSPSFDLDRPTEAANSKTSLIRKGSKIRDAAPAGTRTSADAKSKSQIAKDEPPADYAEAAPEPEEDQGEQPLARHKSRGLVQFNLPGEAARTELQAKARLTQMNLRRAASRSIRRSKAKDGEIIKTEKMLVRVDFAIGKLPDDYDENDSQKLETRTTEKWREYMVVCRETTDEDAEFYLQLYKTRVIPTIEETHGKKKRSKYEIAMNRKSTKVNMYSSLDKSIVIWLPHRKGTLIYIMQARSGANATEWFTFLRNILGLHRTSELQVSIPDLSVSLRLDKPFEKLQASRDVAQAAEGDEEAFMRVMAEEQAVAGNIVKRCMTMLEGSPEWSSVIDSWAENGRIGLAWKRYDRLEWIYGANERKMYGTIAMTKAYDLELRPKMHYPTMTKNRKGESLVEPPPVEGFLIRLTSQQGKNQKMGRLFFKRLYFATQDQYLCFSRPAKATPPPPPKLPASHNRKIPTAQQIQDKIPLIYAVNPYPMKDGEIEWLAEGHSGTTEDRRYRDRDAEDESERNLHNLVNCDGYINLCNIVRVRKVQPGATPADDNLDEGSDIDFDQDVDDTRADDGETTQYDIDRTFELLMKNRLVIRLQAFDKTTQKEWMAKLRALVRYWKHRTTADIDLYKQVRQQNLSQLNIDEETEAYVGQFARKWEVSKSYASPELYNICGISSCRTIRMSGTLYRKPRRHATFTRCSVLLADGRMLVFADQLRKRTGKSMPHIHHERISSIDLRGTYLYSGLLTENDLLYQNTTFDSNKPGHHALPRIYLQDGWTSTDEDVMTCFVLWHGKKRSWFRSETSSSGGGEKPSVGPDEGYREGGKRRLKHLSALGVPGKAIVFRARSRAERDHWVLAIQGEIERVAEEEDFRLKGAKTRQK